MKRFDHKSNKAEIKIFVIMSYYIVKEILSFSTLPYYLTTDDEAFSEFQYYFARQKTCSQTGTVGMLQTFI